MDDIDAAFDDAYRTHRIEAGDDPSTLPNPYSRPTLAGGAANGLASTSSTSANPGGGFVVDDTDAVGGGGYIVDDTDAVGGGGFIVDDTDAVGGGGFIVDDDDAPVGGGFMPEDQEEDVPSPSCAPPRARPSTIPLSAVPEALSKLGVDSADASVLSLFAEAAYVPSSASRRRLAPGVKPEKVVGRHEFQQVASILVDEIKSRTEQYGQEDVEEASNGRRRRSRRAAVQARNKTAEIIEADERGAGGFIVDDEADDSEQDFELSRLGRGNKDRLDTGSDLTSDGEQDNSIPQRRRRRAAAQTQSTQSIQSDSEPEHTRKRQRRTRQSSPSLRPATYLNPLQRSRASTLFSLLLDHLPHSDLPLEQRRIGSTELSTILSALGHNLPPTELEEMIEQGANLFAPATLDQADQQGQPRSNAAIKRAAAAQRIVGSSVGLDEFAGILIHNRLL